MNSYYVINKHFIEGSKYMYYICSDAVYPYLSGHKASNHRNIKPQGVTLEEQKLSPQKFSISYPILPADDDNKAWIKINNAITGEVSNLFKSQVLLTEKTDFNEVLGTYEVTVNKNSILSILFSLYTYVDGAAHGVTAYSSITANTDTGQIYSFSDLFNSKVYYVGTLNELANQYIKDNNIQLINEYKGVTPNQQYYLTPNSLVLYYQPYEYTPGYYGLFKVVIPYNKIQNILSPLSPITKLI